MSDATELLAEINRLTANLQTVQNAAKNIASAHGTELEHRRQNSKYDHKLRAEHDSLIERDAIMADRITALEADNKRLRDALTEIRDNEQSDLNMSNYTDDDVRHLNDAYIDIYRIAASALEEGE